MVEMSELGVVAIGVVVGLVVRSIQVMRGNDRPDGLGDFASALGREVEVRLLPALLVGASSLVSGAAPTHALGMALAAAAVSLELRARD